MNQKTRHRPCLGLLAATRIQQWQSNVLSRVSTEVKIFSDKKYHKWISKINADTPLCAFLDYFLSYWCREGFLLALLMSFANGISYLEASAHYIPIIDCYHWIS